MKQKRPAHRRSAGKLPWLWIGACLMGAGVIMMAAAELLRLNGLELLNQSIYYAQRGIIISGAAILAVTLLRRYPKTAYIKNMVSVLGMVVIVSTWVYVYMWSPFLKAEVAEYTNEGHKVAVIRSYMYDQEISDRLNEQSRIFMEEARDKAKEAQANGEKVQEVANTVFGVDMLQVYNAYPVKLFIFYDAYAKVEGNVYTLLGATSAQLKLDWPEANVAHLYVEGAEGEGESFTYLN